MIIINMRTGRGQNNREHWRAASKRKRIERELTAVALIGRLRPKLPCMALLTRHAPSTGLDDDNLSGSLKSVRDQVARWLGVDDKNTEIVKYEYAQRRGTWAVTIEFKEMAS